MVTALIDNLKRRQNNEKLFESDYFRVMGAILPHYFTYNRNYTISPEIWSEGERKSDFVVAKTYLGRGDNLDYGHSIPVVMVESKNRGAIPWKDLAKDKFWNQTDCLKNDDGRLWIIGQIGFTICFIRFDLLNYTNSEWFRNFSPLNLKNFNEDDLDYLEIKYISESIDNNNILQVIEWKLDEPSHYQYIHEMFEHILNNDP